MTSYLAVVPDVGIGHHQAVTAEPRNAAAALRSSRNRDVFADHIAVADFKLGGLTLVLQILRRNAGRCERKNLVSAAQPCMAVHNNMRHQLAIFRDLDICADRTKRSDDASRANRRCIRNDAGWVDQRGGMNTHASTAASCGVLAASLAASALIGRLRGTICDVTVPSQISLPSTYAFPCIRIMRLRQFSTSI